MAFYLRQNRSWLLLAAVFLIFSRCAPTTVINESTGKVDGALVYKKHCISCHGKGGDRGLSDAANLKKSRLSPSEIRKTILYGTENGMSAYEEVITHIEEINALVKHVKSLQEN